MHSKPNHLAMDMWEALNGDPTIDAFCITTNGFVKKNGCAVMGRGIAKQAKERFHGIEYSLGRLLLKGVRTQIIPHIDNFYQHPPIISLPVKPAFGICNADKSNVVPHMRKSQREYLKVPGWAMVADLDLIARSLNELVSLCDRHSLENIILPRPGCGAGELSFDKVKPLVDEILDDRFTVCTYPKVLEYLNKVGKTI